MNTQTDGGASGAPAAADNVADTSDPALTDAAAGQNVPIDPNDPRAQMNAEALQQDTADPPPELAKSTDQAAGDTAESSAAAIGGTGESAAGAGASGASTGAGETSEGAAPPATHAMNADQTLCARCGKTREQVLDGELCQPSPEGTLNLRAARFRDEIHESVEGVHQRAHYFQNLYQHVRKHVKDLEARLVRSGHSVPAMPHFPPLKGPGGDFDPNRG